jgi:hypothetical protein
LVLCSCGCGPVKRTYYYASSATPLSPRVLPPELFTLSSQQVREIDCLRTRQPPSLDYIGGMDYSLISYTEKIITQLFGACAIALHFGALLSTHSTLLYQGRQPRASSMSLFTRPSVHCVVLLMDPAANHSALRTYAPATVYWPSIDAPGWVILAVISTLVEVYIKAYFAHRAISFLRIW